MLGNYGSTKLFCTLFVLLFVVEVEGHEGPDPLGHWMGRSDQLKDGQLISRLGPNGSLSFKPCLLYTSPSPRDATLSRMPSSA